MKRILFVDDETKVLDGLRRMLRPLRREWEMKFCQSGQEALAALSEEPFDVIVTDMRMPGMDGAALLAEVASQHPRMVRIVLSGQSSKEATIKSVGVAHQYLAKPCDADKLKHTINHAFALRDLLTDDTLKQVLSRLKSVPSMPTLYTEIMEELAHEDASVTRVGEIVAQDPGMTTKILQLVNSAFFGLPRHVSNPAQAAGLLGTETIKALVLSMDVFSQFENTTVEGLSPSAVQQHSAETAALAKRIAQSEKATKDTADASLMAGFLHDIGKLILAQNMPGEYGEVMARVRDTGVSACEAERAVLGATHADVGAYLLGLWGLPDAMVEAAAFHHRPGESLGDAFSPLTAVHAADAILNDQEREGDLPGAGLDLDYLDKLGLADRVPAWRKACEELLHVGAEA